MTVLHHLARTDDPGTSKAAAYALSDKSTMRLRLLRQYVQHHLTSEEATHRAGYTAEDGAWKRVSDLVNDGSLTPLVINGQIVTRPGSSGRQQRVLTITTTGLSNVMAALGY